MNVLRAGVIGVGYLGQFHAEKYAKLEGVELTGVVDPDRERAAQVAAKLSTRSCADPSELLGKVDIVSIVAPTVLHHRLARPFLEQGVHVLLEKPMTVTLDEADDLIALAGRKNVLLQIGHIERFNPAITSIRPLLRSPRYLQAERSAPFTVRCTDVNVVLDLMIHDLDIVSALAGAPPVRLSAAGASLITKEIDTASARIVFGNGCVADVSASRVSDEKKRILKVFDQDVLYTADYQAQRSVRSRREGEQAPELVSADVSAERRDTLYEEIASFVTCVRTGTRPIVAGSDGRNALALAIEITRNIEEGNERFVDFA